MTLAPVLVTNGVSNVCARSTEIEKMIDKRRVPHQAHTLCQVEMLEPPK